MPKTMLLNTLADFQASGISKHLLNSREIMKSDFLGNLGKSFLIPEIHGQKIARSRPVFFDEVPNPDPEMSGRGWGLVYSGLEIGLR